MNKIITSLYNRIRIAVAVMAMVVLSPILMRAGQSVSVDVVRTELFASTMIVDIEGFPILHFFADPFELLEVGIAGLGGGFELPMLFEVTDVSATQARVRPPVAVAAEPVGTPGKLVLEQNYPNPFNPSTMIRYALPAGTKVKLSVHTLLGSQIKVLVEQFQDAGTYSFDFSAQDLPSGAYFYRLQTDQGTITRRMIVSK